MNLDSTGRELLSHEETISLIMKSQNGDEKAREKLVEHNLGLVRSVLRSFMNRGYDGDDLFQIGSIGLLKAIDKFDNSFDVRFSTYAVPMIIGEIKRFLRDDGLIKVSRSLKQIAADAKRVEEELFKVLGREPTILEISEEVGLDVEEVVMAMEASYQPEYLHRVLYQNDGAPLYLIDKISIDKDENKKIIDKIFIKEILSQLKARDRQVIVLRYFQDKTQTEVAELLDISQVQVSRIEKRIISEIKLLHSKA